MMYKCFRSLNSTAVWAWQFFAHYLNDKEQHDSCDRMTEGNGLARVSRLGVDFLAGQ